MNKHTFNTKPNVLPDVVHYPHAGASPQEIALALVDEYKRTQSNPDFSKIGVYNARVHPTRRGHHVEFVFSGMRICTLVQETCTYQVRKPCRSRKVVDNKVW